MAVNGTFPLYYEDTDFNVSLRLFDDTDVCFLKSLFCEIFSGIGLKSAAAWHSLPLNCKEVSFYYLLNLPV